MNGAAVRSRTGAFTVAALMLAGFLASRLLGEDRRIFLPGATSGGHHQIEIDCAACHDPFRGVREQACVDCHGERLRLADDSHPRSKFTDPRNADRLASLDARRCLACHREHAPAATRPMGVTLPDDLCVHCHAGVAEERASHRGFAFDTCASGGCHNFHDNTALYEDFLAGRAGEPAFLAGATVPVLPTPPPYRAADGRPEIPPDLPKAEASFVEWSASAHAGAAVACVDCHRGTTGTEWIDRPALDACARCHALEADGWRRGKHGMRLSRDLPPMRPRLARLAMRADALERELGCTSCHAAHRFDRQRAAVAACLDCHADDHSLAYESSSHARSWAAELSGSSPPGSGVSCATCHLPRTIVRRDGEDEIAVQHNQNHNLRPNEKMIRDVCLHCHGLAFAIDSLADAALVRRNFLGRPARHVESIEMALRRETEHVAADTAAREGKAR